VPAKRPVGLDKPMRSTDPSSWPISIDLTPQQIDRVVRAASGESVLPARLAEMRAVRALLPGSADSLRHDPRLSQSLILGMTIFAALPTDGTYVSISTLVSSIGLSPSTVHRYLATLVALGLAERNPRTRGYRVSI
jgi:hypothetical protein